MQAATFLGDSLSELHVRPVERREEARYQAQMACHHYLGELPKIGETVWYVAIWREQWVAQLSPSAAALKCGVRDRWIGWDFRSQYGRLKLIANISRSSDSSEQQRTRLATGCGAICRGQIGVLVKRVLGLIMPPTTKLVRRSTSSLMSSEA